MEKSSAPTALTGGGKTMKREWDERFERVVSGKQELPQQPRIATMNGSIVKSSLRHIRQDAANKPHPINIARATKSMLPSHPQLIHRAGREKEKDRNVLPRNVLPKNQLPESKGEMKSELFTTFGGNNTDVNTGNFNRTNSSCLSMLTTATNSLANTNIHSYNNTKRNLRENYDRDEVEAGHVYDQKDEYDYAINSTVSQQQYQSQHQFQHQHTGTGRLKHRLSSLKIDVSTSVQTIDKEEDEMRKEIDDRTNLGLIGVQNPGRKISNFGVNSNLKGNINLPKPLHRLEIIGRGSSAVIYKSILLGSLQICAEKVIIVSDPSKRQQMMNELQSLKKIVRDKNHGDNKCPNIIGLLDIVSNPQDGTISICLEFMNGKY